MSNNTLAQVQSNLPASQWESQLDVVKGMIGAEKLDDQEFALFVAVAKSKGLDPLARQIHAVPYNSKDRSGNWRTRLTIITGIDGYRLIAARSGQHAGTDDAEFGPLIEHSFVKRGRDGAVEGKPKLAKVPEWSRVTVYKIVQGVRVPFSATARWLEYCPDDGNKWTQWARMPYAMLAKCAEALALRKAFPADLSGLYVEDEVQNIPREVYDVDPETGEVLPPAPTATAKTAPVSTAAAAVAGAVANTPRPAQPQSTRAIEAYMKAHDRLGAPSTDSETVLAAWSKKLGRTVESSKDLTTDEWETLTMWVESMMPDDNGNPAIKAVPGEWRESAVAKGWVFEGPKIIAKVTAAPASGEYDPFEDD